MSINLVSLAMKFITPDMLLKLAGATGLQGMILQKALGAIVPAILGGVVGKAATPSGARGLFDILSKQDPGILGKLGGLIGGAGQAEAVKQGGGLLASVLGGGAAAGLAGAVAKYAGIGEGPANMLMGLIGPAVLGTVGQTARDSNLDAGGLASLLAGQKSNITAAMPSGFADMLKGTGLTEGLTSAAAPVAAATRVQSAPTPSSQSASMSWMPWALGAAAVLGLGWMFLGGKPATTIAVPSAPAALSAGASEAATKVTSTFTGLRTTLGSIKDVDSAKAALPRLQGAVGEIDAVSVLAAKLPPDARKALGGMVGGLSPSLDPLFKSALAITGVPDVLKPVIDALQSKIGALAKG